MITEHKSMGYGAGTAAVFVISIGVAAIAYSMNWVGLNLYNIPAWLFGPLGIFTVLYSLVAGKDWAHYLAWGTIMTSAAVISGLYDKVQPLLVIGIVLIVLAIIGIIAYWRRKK
jgi:hypothetical protein